MTTFTYFLIYGGVIFLLLPPLIFNPPAGMRLNKKYYFSAWAAVSGLSFMVSPYIQLQLIGAVIAFVGVRVTSRGGDIYE